MTTADGKINHSEFDELVQLVNRKNSEKNGWKVNSLKPGTYGYDNLAHCIVASHGEVNMNKLCHLIHDAWTYNYLYWRDNKPWETNTYYKKPFQPLGDERRDNCAALSFDLLPSDEQAKDVAIAEILLEIIAFPNEDK